MVVLAALHIGWLKFLAVFLTGQSKEEVLKSFWGIKSSMSAQK